ncbi:MAG TPA: GTP cyclohydrolase I FolE [Candidatus Krumholzibacteria bacterium]|nr:GTP cyclohydrolase I FolE [Candidatus Krumholzibacteria bacterium]
MEELIRKMLLELGEDPNREGLQRTPQRVAEAWQFLCNGYRGDVEEAMNDAIFDSENREMVMVKNIDFYSMCEHHMLPFFGKAGVAYIPDGKIIGLSKMARIVEIFARRLQVQERLTTQIANALNDYLHPQGVAVVIRAQHLCMMMRGVEKQNSIAITSEMLGAFRNRPATRAEMLSLLHDA